MAVLFEIVIFTAAQQDYADFIIDQLDRSRSLIRHRLYRQHCILQHRGCVKDLAALGRNLA